MKILIMNSTGELISIPIGENETFRELNNRMEKDHGMRMSFANLQHDNSIDLDQNIPTYLSENNRQAAVGSVNSLPKSKKEEEIKLSEESVRERDHRLVEEDPELLEDFHAVLEGIKSEERNINEDIESVDIKPTVLYENHQVLATDTNTPLLCRLCASQRNDTVYMFGQNKMYRNIIEKIEHCLPIVVRETDTLPKQACHSCLEKLEFCHQFYKSVGEAEKQLTMLGRKISDEFWQTDKHYQTSLLQNEQCGSTEHEIELKTSSDEDSNNNQSITVPGEVQIAKQTAERSGSSSISMLRSEKLITSETNATNSITVDKKTDSARLNKTSTSQVEQNLTDSKADETLADYSLVRKTIRCRVCGKLFRTAAKCDLHSTIHASENYYPCSICNETFTIMKDWNEHRLEHIENEKLQRKTANYACNECDKKFVTEARLQFHKINHSSEAKPFYCKKCDKIMESKPALYQHMLAIHPKDKDHCCDVCGKKFRSESQLNGHKGKHNDKRFIDNFSCAHCEKSFEQKSGLIIHIRSHTGERPFSCDLCDKSYKTKAQRTSHRRTHTGEKPFKCTTCGKTFAQALRLSEHANVHTVTRPYKCSVCDKSFKRIHARTIHMTTHTGEKLYQCNVCKKSFRWPSAIRRHKKYQHKGIK